MSKTKELKALADEHGVEYAKNAKEEKMQGLLLDAGVDFKHLYGGDVESEAAPERNPSELPSSAPKKGREADEEARIAGDKEGMVYLGNCVKTGEPLYKKISK